MVCAVKWMIHGGKERPDKQYRGQTREEMGGPLGRAWRSSHMVVFTFTHCSGVNGFSHLLAPTENRKGD